MRTSLIAGAIGIVLVMLFMLIVYRIPGLVASIALCFYMVLEALIFSLVRVNLSLPGIAGIILSIGMAVDANVIIFERVKEELKNGKTVKSAIDSGFKRAFTAILDSNITTLIACAVLFFLGTGTIVGFATTLGIGGFLAACINIIAAAYFSAAGQASRGFIISLVRSIIAIPPVLFALSALLSITGVWLTFPAVEALACVLSLLFILRSPK